MKSFVCVLVLFLSLAGLNVAAQTDKPSENVEKKVTQPELKDFVTFFRFNSGYSNTVSLKTAGANRTFRMEGERCYLEAVFPLQDALGGQERTWVIPAASFARASTDDTFCLTGRQVPILIQKETKKSFLGSTYQLGEFNWGSFRGSFEIK